MVVTPITGNSSLGKSSKKYSLSRLVKSKSSTGNEHCFEAEISSDLESKFGNREFDFLIPPEVLGLRTIATDNTGANLIAKEQSDFYYLAPQPNSFVIPLGAKLLTNLKDNYEINGSVDSFQANWVGERGLIEDSQPEVTKTVLKPKKIVASMTMTVEMWNQATEFADNFLALGMARALWSKIDEAVLMGNGVTQPLGIVSQPDVNSIILGIDGDYLFWSAIVEMESLVTKNNPHEKSLGYLVNSDTASYLKKAQKINDSGEFILQDQPLRPTDEFKVLNSRLCGITNHLSNNLNKGTSTDLSMAIFGDWSTVVIGIFGALDLQVDRYTNGNSSKGLVTLRMLARVDVGFLNPRLFTVATDVKTS